MRVRIEFLYFSLWTHPHPPRIRSAPSPWEGEGLAGDRKGRPYGGNALVALVR